jgi:outer membrane protein assembly factor BamE (lipoprotein component of BamABCDE complex)
MNTTTRVSMAGLAAALAVALGACTTKLGREFDSSLARQITPGTTTKADVRAKLGRPPLVTRGAEEDVWIYAYYVGGGMSADFKNWMGQADVNNPRGARQSRLIVTFRGDVVKDSRLAEELPPPDPLEPQYR